MVPMSFRKVNTGLHLILLVYNNSLRESVAGLSTTHLNRGQWRRTSFLSYLLLKKSQRPDGCFPCARIRRLQKCWFARKVHSGHVLSRKWLQLGLSSHWPKFISWLVIYCYHFTRSWRRIVDLSGQGDNFVFVFWDHKCCFCSVIFSSCSVREYSDVDL